MSISKVRAIALPHLANAGKVELISEFISLWRSALTICKHDKIRHLRKGGKITRFNKDQWTLKRPDFLSARQWKSVENQVNASLKSWQELAVIEGRKVIAEWVQERKLDDDERTALYRINASKSWWDAERGNTELIDTILTRCPFPVFDRTRAVMFDDNIAPVRKSQDTDHEWWIDLRLLNGLILPVPVVKTTYYLEQMAAGKECAVTNVTFTPDGELSLHRMVRTPKAEQRKTGIELGIDWGLSTLVATSDGRLLGRRLYLWLKERDQEITDLSAHLQRLGVPLKKSQRLRKLHSRVRSHVRNEVGRVLNQIATDDVRSLTVEHLDFRGGGLSKTLNRLVSRAGRAAFNAKLTDLEESHGIAVVEINPAYTSQQCHSCGYVDRRNRRQSRLKCQHCGRNVNADINAARNIALRRSQETSGFRYIRKETVLTYLDDQFTRHWRCEPHRLRERL